MKLLAFAFLDTKTGAFGTPFFASHRGQALRITKDLAADLSTTIGRHPEDFAICELGAWDDGSGAFENQVPLNLGLAVAFLDRQPQSGFQFDASPADTRPVTINGDAR